MPTFCRHNRFTADCPICSKGTVLDPDPRAPARRPRSARKAQPSPEFKGEFASVGPYPGDDGEYELRLERVPGGLRLAAWTAGAISRQAPVLAVDDLGRLLAESAEKGLLDARAEWREPAAVGVSPGRAGELREELRAERMDGDRLRIARWILRPNRGWELQEAPVMLPAERYLEALEGLASGQPDPTRH